MCAGNLAFRGAIVNLEQSIIANRIKAIQALRTNSPKNLSSVHVEILFIVFVKEQITRQDLICNIPNISEATVKRYVADLVHDHMLLKEKVCETDSRLKYLSVTQKGLKLIYEDIKNIKKCTALL